MFKNIKIVLILLLVSQPLLAQDVSFKTSVSKTRMGLNERLQVSFTINKQGGDNFKSPNFKDFKVLAGPMPAVSSANFNGQKFFKMTYTFIIEPKRKGQLTISSASMEYEGFTLKTNPVKITVTKAIEIPKDPNDPQYIASQNIHLIAELSNPNPYVGESISVIYKIFVDVTKVEVRNFQPSKTPIFNGFLHQEVAIKKALPKDGSFQGKHHRYAIVKKVILTPQKSGKLIITPLEMEIGAAVPSVRRDILGRLIKRSISYTASAGSRTVEVKPLPINNKPDDFSGAVGDFDFKITTNKTKLKANEATQIKVEVTGMGNLKMIDLPDFEAPNGLEKYEPEHKENIKTTINGFSGNTSDIYTIVPQFRGKYKIPSVTFSFFSLKENAYKTIMSDEIIIDVPQGNIPTEVDGVNSVIKKDVLANAKDIRFISLKANLKSKTNTKDFYKSSLFYALLVLPLLAIPFGIFIGRKKQQRDSDVIGNKRRMADKLAKKYLSEAKKQIGKKEAFYIALEKALHNYLKAQLHVETTDISKEKISELLQERLVDRNSIDEFVKVLDDCDYARYTPSSNVMMQEEYETARKVIAKIDKQL